jgi:hypothetical protein
MPRLTASELEKLNQQKTVYANIFYQQQLYALGLIPQIRYQNTSHMDNSLVLTGFTGGGIKLNDTSLTNAKTTSAADLAKIKTVVTNLKTTYTSVVQLTSIAFAVLDAYSAALGSSWSISRSYAVTVRYYSALTSSGTKTLVGIQNKPAGTTVDILATYTPEAGLYYFVGITPSGGSESLSAPMFMPYPAPTGVVINDLTYTSSSLGSSWIQIPASAVTVNYYVSSSVYPSGGTLVGTSQSVLSGTLVNTLVGYTPVAGSFYYVGVTPTNGSETLSPIATQMPYPLVSSVSLNNLTNTSSTLGCSWSVIPTAALVTVKYYATTSTVASGGTQVGTTQSPSSGVLTNTISFIPVAGTYYYAGVTGPSGTEVASNLATLMPYPVASGVSLGSLGNSSTSLSATWSVTPASSVTVNYYSNASNSTTGGTLVATQTIASGTLIATYSYTPASGLYYYAGVVPTGGSEVLSGTAKQMPYAVASGVTLNALVKSSTVLGSSWAVVNASAVTVKYYDNGTTNSTSGGTQIGTSQTVANGVTTNTLPGTYTMTSGNYFYVGVTPTGGSEVLSAVATKKDPAVAFSVALGALADSSTGLTSTWALDVASSVTIKYYSTNSTTASNSTQVGTSQSVASGTYVNSLTFTPVIGTYYCLGVTPQGGSETLSAVATLMPAATASAVLLGSLTASSVGLTSSWSLTSSQQVSVQYYYNATASNTVAGATAVGSAQTVAAGTTVQSLTIALVPGKYYFVGVTPSGGTQVVSAATTQMPYAVASGVSLSSLTTSSTGLSSSWTVTPSSDVSVQYYSTNSSTVPNSGGTTVGSAQAVTSGTTNQSLTTSLTAGTYYYVGVTPTGGSQVRSSVAIQMPYSAASAVVLGALDPGTNGFSATWSLSSASDVVVRFYSSTSQAIPASKTQVGSNQTVTSGTTSMNVTFTTLGYTGVAGTYYFVGVQPTNGTQVYSSLASQLPYATAASLTLTGITHNSTTLIANWGVSPASQVTVKFYQYRNSGEDNTQLGTTQTVASGTTTYTLTASTVIGYYYRVGVTPSGGSEALSAKVLKPTNFTSIILNSISNSTTSLSGTWSADTAMPQTIYFYKNGSNSTTGGTLINTGGTAVAQQNASVSYTYTPESGYYYYMGVSATGATEIIYSSTQYLATTTITSASMSALTVSSTNIQVSWAVPHRTQVTVVIYTSASSATTSTGTFETQVVEAGITTATSAGAPAGGTYYFVTVTARGGASTATSVAAILMPQITASAVTLGALTSSSTTLSSSWSVSSPTAVTVKYYTTNSTAVPGSGRVQLGASTYSVSSGTTTHTLSGFPPVGPTYYYVSVTPSGGTETFSSVATLMPGSGIYETSVAINLNAIDSSHFNGSLWYDLASGQSITMNSLAYNSVAIGNVAIGKAVKLMGSTNYGTKTNTSVPFDITGGFTYEVWLYYKVATVGGIAQSSIFETQGTNRNGLFMNGAGNISIFSANVGSTRTDTNVGTYTKNSSYSTAGSALQIPINQWIHMVTTVSSTATSLYINTQLVAQQTYSTAITQQGATNTVILGDSGVSESYIARARVYTTPLATAKIRRNYNSDSAYFGLSSVNTKILVMGDSGASTTATVLSARLTALGYTNFTVNSQLLSTTYDGTVSTGLVLTDYDTAIIFTNASQTGAAGLSTALRNYVNTGGNLISATFIWNLYPSGFDFTTTPFTSNSQSTDATGNMVTDITHPITTGIGTALNGGSTIATNGTVTLQSGATKIAHFSSSGDPLVAINTVGNARLVGINASINGLGNANLRDLVVNSCLWVSGLI